jgi:DNA-binding phage protein
VEIKIGNTKIVIKSQLAYMTSEERSEWYRSETEKGNPTLNRIAKAVNACYDDAK